MIQRVSGCCRRRCDRSDNVSRRRATNHYRRHRTAAAAAAATAAAASDSIRSRDGSFRMSAARRPHHVTDEAN